MSPKATQDAYTPRPEHRFTFGLWTVGNPGRDPFGDRVRPPRAALGWYRDAINFLCEYVRSQRYDLRFALEAKPNEPRGDIFLPTTGHMLAFIYTLDHPDMVGVNPEVAHERMAGLDFSHGVAQALEAGKLFHIDLNGQQPGRFDQDLRFGSDDPKAAFFLVKLLEDSKWPGMRHFDSHAYRTEDEDGVWGFAAGSMRTYLILKAKVERFNHDAEIQQLLAELGGRGGGATERVAFSTERARALQARTFDLAAIRTQGYAYERLDQLTMELLLGVR